MSLLCALRGRARADLAHYFWRLAVRGIRHTSRTTTHHRRHSSGTTAMTNYCDRTHSNWATKAMEESGATVPTYIPTITEPETQKLFALSHLAQAPSVSEDTALELASIVKNSYYHQQISACARHERYSQSQQLHTNATYPYRTLLKSTCCTLAC